MLESVKTDTLSLRVASLKEHSRTFLFLLQGIMLAVLSVCEQNYFQKLLTDLKII